MEKNKWTTIYSGPVLDVNWTKIWSVSSYGKLVYQAYLMLNDPMQAFVLKFW